MDKEIQNAMRELTRSRIHKLWVKAKNNDMEGATEEDKRTMKVILEHEDEYAEIYDQAESMGDYEFDPETEHNPFMHITMHTIVENQLAERDPIEVYQFYLAMRQKKYPRHDTIHLISNFLSRLIYRVLKYHDPFGPEQYKFLLKKYKNRKPEKIYDLLDQEDEEEEEE
jgi:hypothetical protein